MLAATPNPALSVEGLNQVADQKDEPVGEPALGTFQLSLTGGPTPLGLGATARF